MIAFANDIETEFNNLNQQLRSERNDMKFKKKVCELIEFHSVARQFAGDFTKAFQWIYAFYFVWTTVTICCNLLMLQVIFVAYFIISFRLKVSHSIINLWMYICLDKRFVKCVGNRKIGRVDILVIHSNFHILRYKWTRHKSLQRGRHVLFMRLVCISGSRTTYDANHNC